MTQAELDKAYQQALAQCTEHEQLVIREYLIDLRKGDSYTRATPGVSPRTAPSACTRMLLRERCDNAVKAGMAARGHKIDLTAEKVLTELMRLGFANLADYVQVNEAGEPSVDLSDLTRDQAAAISEITTEEIAGVKRTKIKLYDKGQNLERLGRYLKLFTDKVEVAGLEELVKRIQQARQNSVSDDDITG